jgi:DNA-binding MarR family transcriptional regulator
MRDATPSRPPEQARRPAQTNPKSESDDLSDREYEQLAHFRSTVRQLFRQTELEAAKLGISPQQYQLLLAIKGFPGRDWANISELAERLQVRHNAVIGLVNRAEAHGLVQRRQDDDRTDRRTVRVSLTPEGERILGMLVAVLRGERQRVREAVASLADETGPEPVARSS